MPAAAAAPRHRAPARARAVPFTGTHACLLVSRLMDRVAAKANALPDEDCCRDLLRFLTAVSARMDEVRAKAEAGPPVKDRIEQPTVRRGL